MALAIAIAFGWLPYRWYGRSALARLVKLRSEVARLREENALLRTQAAQLRSEVALYEEDPRAAVERAARDELGMVRPGEVVFKLDLPQ